MSDVRLGLRWGVELRDGRIVSAHGEKEWADQELKFWMLYGPMVVDLGEKPKNGSGRCGAFTVGATTNKCAECGFSRRAHT